MALIAFARSERYISPESLLRLVGFFILAR